MNKERAGGIVSAPSSIDIGKGTVREGVGNGAGIVWLVADMLADIVLRLALRRSASEIKKMGTCEYLILEGKLRDSLNFNALFMQALGFLDLRKRLKVEEREAKFIQISSL